MPTELPPSRQNRTQPITRKQSKISLLFNIFMVASALALTYVVLVTEQRYGFGPRHDNVVTIEISPDRGTVH